jgi:NTP pyrophosphatase (non-canonical NTP hydrolase)
MHEKQYVDKTHPCATDYDNPIGSPYKPRMSHSPVIPPADYSLCVETVDQILKELDRAVTKFPTWPTDPLHALAVLGEEYGELNKAILQLTYEPHKEGASVGHVKEEAIQTAAMALRLAMSLDKYEYAPGRQHTQSS